MEQATAQAVKRTIRHITDNQFKYRFLIKRHILSLLFTFMAGSLCLFGQDPGYTQFYNVPIYYNPAYTGLATGFRVRFCTRNQGPELETSLRSYHLSADIADRNLPGAGGIGLIFNTDNEGVGFIKNYNLGVSVSARVPLSGFVIGQVGVKIAWLQKRIAWNDFVLSEKIQEKYGHIYDSGYTPSAVNVLNLPDFAIGGLVQFINRKGCVSGTVGISADHLFEPDVSFIPTEKATLSRRWTGHADVIWMLKCRSGINAPKDSRLKINPGFVFQHQGELNSLQAGLNSSIYGLCAGAWYKGDFGLYSSNSLALLGGYRYVFAENMSIKFTYSYDLPLSGAVTNSGGAHEISLVLEFNKVGLFKKSKGSSNRSMTPDGIDERLSRLAF